jgi:hypothetical protein
MFCRICQLPRERQVRLGSPPVDKDIHDAAAGADFLLVEVAGQVDLGKTRVRAILK